VSGQGVITDRDDADRYVVYTSGALTAAAATAAAADNQQIKLTLRRCRRCLTTLQPDNVAAWHHRNNKTGSICDQISSAMIFRTMI